MSGRRLLSRLRTPGPARRKPKEFDLFLVLCVIGAFWSPHLGWRLAEVVLAGSSGALVSEVGIKFSLTRACYGWLAVYLRRELR